MPLNWHSTTPPAARRGGAWRAEEADRNRRTAPEGIGLILVDRMQDLSYHNRVLIFDFWAVFSSSRTVIFASWALIVSFMALALKEFGTKP